MPLLLGPPDAPDPAADVQALCKDLGDGLTNELGDRLVSLYLFGAMAFPRPETWLVDVDFHVLLTRPPTKREVDGVSNLHDRLADRWPLGDELDGHYLLMTDVKSPEWPTCQVFSNTDHAWALHRAHVLADRYFLLAGQDPRQMLGAPTWAELEASLDAEMQFIIGHPEHAAFGVLNACRVLYSVRTHDVVVSKYAAALWGMNELRNWQGVLAAAVRFYTQAADDADLQLLTDRGPDFVSLVVAETGMPAAT